MTSKKLDEKIREITERHHLGATGQYPHGSLGAHDQGELKVAIGIEQGKIVIAFGKKVEWVALTPEGARQVAAVLTLRADQAESGGEGQ